MRDSRHLDLAAICGVALISVLAATYGTSLLGLQIVFGVLLVVLLPGYTLTEALLPAHPMHPAERVLLSIALSLASTAVGGLLLHLTRFGLSAAAWSILLCAITVTASTVAVFRRRDVDSTEFVRYDVTRLKSLFRNVQQLNTPVTLLAVAAVILVLAFVVARYGAIDEPRRGFTQLWILPVAAAGTNAVEIGVHSKELETQQFRLEVAFDGDSHTELVFELEPDQDWTELVNVPDGVTTVGAHLFRADRPAETYRQVAVRVGADSNVAADSAPTATPPLPPPTPTPTPTAAPSPTATTAVVTRPTAAATATLPATATVTATVAATVAATPPAGRVVFSSTRDGQGELYLLDPATGTTMRLTEHPAGDFSPVWSPDGRQIAFTSQRDGNNELYLLTLASGTLTRLTEQPAGDVTPAWSPDGTRLAFVSDRTGNNELYVLELASGTLIRLTDHPATEGDPAWSPDGSQLVFSSDRAGATDLYVLTLATGAVAPLTAHPATDWDPVWSPDGSQIAFTSDRDGQDELYLLDLATGALTRLTAHPAADWDPSWSPDGQWLLFASGRDDPRGAGRTIYRVGVDGRGLEPLTSGPGVERDPSWEPAP